MQRYGEIILLSQLGQSANLGRQANGRNRDMPGANAQSFRISCHRKGFEQIFEIGQRFPHSHDDDMRQSLMGGK